MTQVKKIATEGLKSEAALTQYAAICYRYTDKGNLRLLLVTSRDTGRWVLPKGWPMKDRNGGECALTEAYEEAGVFGRLIDHCVGVYSYRKILAPGVDAPCVVTTYPVAVLGLRDDFPERDQRRRKWFAPEKAAEAVDEPELRALLRGFDPAAFGEAPLPGV